MTFSGGLDSKCTLFDEYSEEFVLLSLALPHKKIINEFQAQNPKLMKHSKISAFLINFLADFIKYTKANTTAKFEYFILK